MNLCTYCTSRSRKVAPPAAAPDVQPADNVPIVVNGARAHVTVTLGSINATMLIDTVATLASVNFWTAQALLAKGEAHSAGEIVVVLASGQNVTENQIVINQITIGNHTIPNVVAAVNTNEGDMLLPFPVLNQIGKFTIDTANHKLIFGGIRLRSLPLPLFRRRLPMNAAICTRGCWSATPPQNRPSQRFCSLVKAMEAARLSFAMQDFGAGANARPARKDATAALLATAQAMLADRCVGSGDLPRFRNWVAAKQRLLAAWLTL